MRRMNSRIVEDVLRETEHLAEALRFLLDSVASVKLGEIPEPEVFSGMADMLRLIAENVDRIRRALDVPALSRAVRS
jgi:hypothetical protein